MEGETLSHGFENLHRLVRGKFDTGKGRQPELGSQIPELETENPREMAPYTHFRTIQASLRESQNEYTHGFVYMYEYVLENRWKMLPNTFQETDFWGKA